MEKQPQWKGYDVTVVIADLGGITARGAGLSLIENPQASHLGYPLVVRSEDIRWLEPWHYYWGHPAVWLLCPPPDGEYLVRRRGTSGTPECVARDDTTDFLSWPMLKEDRTPPPEADEAEIKDGGTSFQRSRYFFHYRNSLGRGYEPISGNRPPSSGLFYYVSYDPEGWNAVRFSVDEQS